MKITIRNLNEEEIKEFEKIAQNIIVKGNYDYIRSSQITAFNQFMEDNYRHLPLLCYSEPNLIGVKRVEIFYGTEKPQENIQIIEEKK